MIRSHQSIHDLVRTGRLTAEQGALLMEIRVRLAYARKPWWERVGRFLWKVIWVPL